MYKKIAASFISLSMIVSAFPLNVFASKAEVFTVENINSGVSITSASFKDSYNVVLNVQDLHFNIEAQKKIFDLLEQLNEIYPNFELYAEGASVRSNFDWVYYNLGKKNGDAFIDALFESGNLSGAEYFAAKNAKYINPVEDKEIFNNNLLLFAELIKSRDTIENLFTSLEVNLDNLRQKYLTREQRKLFSVYKSYHNGSISDLKYFEYLKDEASNAGININDYPNIALYMLTSKSIQSVSQKKLQSQMSAIFSDMRNKLSHKQYLEFMALSGNSDDRQALIQYLYKNRALIELEKYPELNKFVFSLIASDKLNQIEFIYEERNLIQNIAKRFAHNENITNVIFVSQFADIYFKSLMTSISADEYAYYKNNINLFKNLISQYINKNALNDFAYYEERSNIFNDINIKRNEIFIKKMFGEIKNPETVFLNDHFGVNANANAVLNTSPVKAKVIVAGGFHTSGINDILDRKQISTITFTPKILSKPLENSSKYIEYAMALYGAENNAIPIPNLYELPADTFVSYVSDSFKLLLDKGMSIDMIKIALESKSEIVSAKINYDEKTGNLIIEYTDNQGRAFTNERNLSETDIADDKNITTLGEMTLESLKAIIASGIVSQRLLRAIAVIINPLASQNEINKLIVELKEEGGIDKYIMPENTELIQKIVIEMFKSKPAEIAEEQMTAFEMLEKRIKDYYPDAQVYVSNAPNLITENGWCFVALETNDIGKTEFYIHDQLLKSLSKLSIPVMQKNIEAILAHEMYEQDAIYADEDFRGPGTIYEDFGNYLLANNLSNMPSDHPLSGRTPENFHKYINSKNFEKFIKSIDPDEIDQQRELLIFASDIQESYLTRHLPVSPIINFTSDKEMPNIADDLVLMRIGNSEILEKYAEELKKHIISIMKDRPGEEFVIAFRKTSPQHIVEYMIKNILPDLGIKVVYIGQDDRMDAASFIHNRELFELRGRLYIKESDENTVLGEKDILGKNIILVEDTHKTGVLFNEMARILNRARVKDILPVAIFDLSKAYSISDEDKRSFNINKYLLNRALDDPAAFADEIIKLNGHVSKYVYNVLCELCRAEENTVNKKAFKEIIGRVSNARVDSEKEDSLIDNMFDDIMDIQRDNYPIAGNMLNIAYNIYIQQKHNQWVHEKVLQKDFTENLIGKYSSEDQKGLLIVDDFTQWQASPFTLVTYALLNGYSKIHIKLKEIDPQAEENLKNLAKIHHIGIIEDLESETVIEGRNITAYEKEALEKDIERLKNSVLEKKQIFDEALNTGHIPQKEAVQNYTDEIKKIIQEVEKSVIRVLAGKKIDISDSKYVIVLGGSLVKGSVTSDSDVYYSIISEDIGYSKMMEDNFKPLFEYMLANIGLTPYASEGALDTYLGSHTRYQDLSFLRDKNISDYRGIANFLDYEVLGRADHPIFTEYIKNYQDFLLGDKEKNKDRQSLEERKERIVNIRRQIGVFSEFLSGIRSDGIYARDKRNLRGNLTFAKNLVAISHRGLDGENPQTFGHRWYLRIIELVLQDLLLQLMLQDDAYEKVDLNNIPRKTDELIVFLKNKKMLTSQEAESIEKAWRVLSTAKQKKAAEGKSDTWTKMSAEEKEAIKFLNGYVIKKPHIEQESKLVGEALQMASTHLTREKFREAVKRVENYANMYGEGKGLGEMYAALLLLDIDEKILNRYFIIGATKEKNNVRSIIKVLKDISEMPSFDELADNSFSVQNYMNLIIKAADKDANIMIGIFADRLQNLLSLDERIAKNAEETESLKSMELRYETLLETSEKKIKSNLLKSLSIVKMQLRKLDEEKILLLEEKNNRLKLFYSVFIPLASKVGFTHAFEYMRNAPFIQNQPDKYNDTINTLRARFGGLEYSALEGIIDDMKGKLESNLNEAGIKSTVHWRLKTIYSIFEKIKGSRRSDKQFDEADYERKYKEKVERLAQKAEKIDGIKRTEEDLREIALNFDKVQDIMGFHIVVNAEDRDKTISAIEDFFSTTSDFKIIEEHKYESEADKGFTRIKYKFSYKDDPVGELVIFSQEQYENEVYGRVLEYSTEVPISHLIYKMGQAAINKLGAMYISRKVDFKQFGIDTPHKTAIFSSDSIVLQNVENSTDLQFNLEALEESLQQKNMYYSVVDQIDINGKKISTRIVGMPDDSTVFDIISASVFDDGKYYIVKAVIDGKETELKYGDTLMQPKLPTTIRYIIQETSDEIDEHIDTEKLKTKRAKVLAIAEKDNSIPDYLQSYGNEEEIADKLEIFINHQGLKDLEELMIALNSGIISREELEYFINVQDEYIIEIQTNYLDKDSKPEDSYDKVKDKILSFKEEYGYPIEIVPERQEGTEISNKLDPDRYQEGIKLVFRGSQEELEKFMSELQTGSLQIKTFPGGVFEVVCTDIFDFDNKVINIENIIEAVRDLKRKDDKQKPEKRRFEGLEINNIEETSENSFKIELAGPTSKTDAFMGALQQELMNDFAYNKRPYIEQVKDIIVSLGKNVSALLENINLSPALVFNSLINIYENSMLDDFFYDDKQLIASHEVSSIKAYMSNIFSKESSVYKDFNFIISDSPDLIADSATYSLATIKVDDSNSVTLYVHKAFLEGLSDMNDEDRMFHLHQLAFHEAQEYLAIEKGEVSGYEEFHNKILDDNPAQAKLMHYASNIAKHIMTDRQERKDLADDITAELTKTENLTKENPADFILICGNDEPATFEKALDIYIQGAADKIAISGGYGRLTIPVMKKAVEMGISVPVSQSRTVKTIEDIENLEKEILTVDVKDRHLLINISEAEIIQLILLDMARNKGLDTGLGSKFRNDLIIDSSASNTRENFDNDIIISHVKYLKALKKGKRQPVRFAYIQTPMQQLRTKATFNAVFEADIRRGLVEGISITVEDLFKETDSETLTGLSTGELIRLIIYSLKGDTLPSINNGGFIFKDIPADIWIKAAILLEHSDNGKEIKKNLLNLIQNTKGPDGNVLFQNKESLISALLENTPADSMEFSAMELFIDAVYDGSSSILTAGELFNYFKQLNPFSLPFTISEQIINFWNVPEFLKDNSRLFIFDTEQNMEELNAYMGSYGAKALSIINRNSIPEDEILFTVKVRMNDRDHDINIAYNTSNTEKGKANEIQMSIPFFSGSTEDYQKLLDKAKVQIINSIINNKNIKEQLKDKGLDLSSISQVFYINDRNAEKIEGTENIEYLSIQTDTLDLYNAKQGLLVDLTKISDMGAVEYIAKLIAKTASVSGDIRDANADLKNIGLYNEKIQVSALMENERDTGIGEITSINSYTDTVLRPAGISGFTMYDIASAKNPDSANIILLDWLAVNEAKGIISDSDIISDSIDQDSVDRENIMMKKFQIAVKVYNSLSDNKKKEIMEYYNENKFLIDKAVLENTEYAQKLNISLEDFNMIMAMQQIFFDRQLKNTITNISDMDISMLLKGIDADNIESAIERWTLCGISSFIIDIDNIDLDIMENLNAVVKKLNDKGIFINISIKSANQDQDTVDLINQYGFAPIISFQKTNQINISGNNFRVEIDDYTLQNNSDINDLLSKTAVSGAKFVDYPIGLLWGESVSDSSIENYRVPAKGSRRFGGINLGLFKVGQQTFEESYESGYMASIIQGRSFTTSKDISFDPFNTKSVSVDGKNVPAVFAAALLGSYAKQNKLSELEVYKDKKAFSDLVIGIIMALGSQKDLSSAYSYLDSMLISFNNTSDEEHKAIEAAKIAGFMQGLSENLIIKSAGNFVSEDMGTVYAKLITEQALLKSGLLSKSMQKDMAIEKVLNNMTSILEEKTLKEAISEIQPVLKNLMIVAENNNFTFDFDSIDDFVESEAEDSEKVLNNYIAITDIMLDILVDRLITEESIGKSVSVTGIDAVRKMLAAA